jgi:GT2 family glycosyltransferase
MPKLSIVIPTIASSGTLDEVLAALAAQDPPLRDAEVRVVLDADAAPALPARNDSAYEFPVTVTQARRPGASAARNHGWRAAGAPLILFLDDDIVPTRTLVAEHLSWHERHQSPMVAVLGSVKWSPAVEVTPFMRWLERGIQFDFGSIEGTEAGWGHFYSCNVSVKRELLDRVDGFDEDRFPYGYEDLELARRLWEQGLRVLYNAQAVGEHLKTETLDGWRRNLRRIAVAERRFTQLHPDARAYFWELFRSAADSPPARGRTARLAPYVSPNLPWLGQVVWSSYDMVCRQRLAGEFLAEWEAAADHQIQ